MKTNLQNLLDRMTEYLNKELKSKLPNVKKEALLDGGAVFYMNGNDGTDFDFECNGRTCEFEIYYKSTEYGAIKAYLCDDGYIRGYCWGDEGKAEGKQTVEEYFCSEDDAEMYSKLLYSAFDLQDKYDEKITA